MLVSGRLVTVSKLVYFTYLRDEINLFILGLIHLLSIMEIPVDIKIPPVNGVLDMFLGVRSYRTSEGVWMHRGWKLVTITSTDKKSRKTGG